MNIAFIGSGNIATFYGKKFAADGHHIVQIISSTLSHAQELASQFNCLASNTTDDLVLDADVYFLAMNDNSVKKYADFLRLPGKVVIHTAGSIALSELQAISEHIACIWCLYSIKKESLPVINTIPVFINYTSDVAKPVAETLAGVISHQVHSIDDEKKLSLHLSAVLVNNYSNHLAAIADQLLAAQHLPFQYLLPILQQTVDKLSIQSPRDAQTGPAIRRDSVILSKHLEMLQGHPEWQALYSALAHSIQSMYPEV